tara:strand:+ start:718 stop:1449 length:732 start_codon:yes stop_codon:yes gene_type:complete
MTPLRIAMWSGPRNLSTALMRSFENRKDTTVIDEPFYAHFLKKTGLEHPGKEEVLKSQSTNWDEIVNLCTGAIPENKPIWYQKHMAQHNIKGYDINWIKNLKNCVLIRDPKYVIASYNKEFPIEDIRMLGYVQQEEIIQLLEKENNQSPPIIDATDILRYPKKILKKLCIRLGIQFSTRMLNWPMGKRNTDGVWANYWYKRVEKSTGFITYKKREIKLIDNLIPLYEECMVSYSKMYKNRIRP